MAGRTMTWKILEAHLIDGSLLGEECAIRVDQVLMQDATGTQACQQLEALAGPGETFIPVLDASVVIDAPLQDGVNPLLQFEQFGVGEIQVPFAIQYVDHNIKQIDERNADDHAFLLTFAKRFGIHYSPLGNGICHQVHVERFAVPGMVLLGADSHTTTSGSVGAFSIGVGGLDIAAVLAGYPFWLRVPKVVNVILRGELQPWVSAKDIILELLRRYGVKWGIDLAGLGGTMVLEFTGQGVQALSVPQRATIANMTAELNATALFPADQRTQEFLTLQRRETDYRKLAPDLDATYDMTVEIDLSALEPLIACPSSPDNVVAVTEVEGTPIAQVCVGSSVNSWYHDLAIVASVLDGRCLPYVETLQGERLLQLLVSPGSNQIVNVAERTGILRKFRKAGGIILESACGPCVGMGGAPPSGTNSLRTMNRNFPGRSGTRNDSVYLASPEVAAATARFGVITDPRTLGAYPDLGPFQLLDHDFTDHLIVKPIRGKAQRSAVKIIRGPHIVPPPRKKALSAELCGEIVVKLGDGISTGSISPDGVIVMGKRSNVADIAKHTFEKELPSETGGASRFYEIAMAAKKHDGGFIVAGETYGQGSSREAAAMVMVELGIHAVLAKSFYRIHRANLIAQGILPLLISDAFYDAVAQAPTAPLVAPGQVLELPEVHSELKAGSATVKIILGGRSFMAKHHFSDRERACLIEGGLINYLKTQA